MKVVFNAAKRNYMRNGKPDSGGNITECETFFEPYPRSLEIGIMGRCDTGMSGICINSGIQCCQDGLHKNEPNMSFRNYKRIIDESAGKTFLVSLGGRGDPDRHKNFGDMLLYTRRKGIVTNYTTSGFYLNSETVQLSKAYCGTVAVSFHNQYYTYRAVRMLLAARVKTNIHFVLSRNSINEAVRRLENNGFPEGVNAVVFLLHKPVGLGSRQNVLEAEDERIGKFFKIIGWKSFAHKIGFDMCSVPGIINFMDPMGRTVVDPCMGARWSAYISPQMEMMPCGFCVDSASWSCGIAEDTIENAWRSEPFIRFRSILAKRCPECSRRRDCLGGCPVKPEIVLCDRKEREHVQ